MTVASKLPKFVSVRFNEELAVWAVVGLDGPYAGRLIDHYESVALACAMVVRGSNQLMGEWLPGINAWQSHAQHRSQEVSLQANKITLSDNPEEVMWEADVALLEVHDGDHPWVGVKGVQLIGTLAGKAVAS